MKENISSRIWQEFAEADDPFSAARCYCCGYDVFGELIKKIDWLDYLYLLIAGGRATDEQRGILKVLTVALANPGPRDHSVQAAMSAGAGGSGSAACLMAALAAGAGNFGGAREVYQTMQVWQRCGRDIQQWQLDLASQLQAITTNRPCTSEETTAINEPCSPSSVSADLANADVWLQMEHPAGFSPYAKNCPTPVKQTLLHLVSVSSGSHLCWLSQHRKILEETAMMPLAMSGVAATAFMDLNVDPEQGEMLYLLLRLPGAAAHALEQRENGWQDFPFFADGLSLRNDPLETEMGKNPAARHGELS